MLNLDFKTADKVSEPENCYNYRTIFEIFSWLISQTLFTNVVHTGSKLDNNWSQMELAQPKLLASIAEIGLMPYNSGLKKKKSD